MVYTSDIIFNTEKGKKAFDENKDRVREEFEKSPIVKKEVVKEEVKPKKKK